MKLICLTGAVYKRLTVIERVPNGKRGVRWRCVCECGRNVIAYGRDLVAGIKGSCGCLRGKASFKHGLTGTALYHCYKNMRRRCDDPKNNSYANYGGRGISYCDKWLTFEGFLDDMQSSYTPGLTLERKDVNENYCKENCCWADRVAQANNRRSNHRISYNGKDYTMAELSRELGVDPDLFRGKIHGGFSVEEAMHKKQVELLVYNGETKSVTEFAKERGMTYHQLKKRLMRGWSLEKALNQPLRKRSS